MNDFAQTQNGRRFLKDVNRIASALETLANSVRLAPPPPQAGGFETTVSPEEVDKALAELTELGMGTALDRPAAILHSLRRAVRKVAP